MGRHVMSKFGGQLSWFVLFPDRPGCCINYNKLITWNLSSKKEGIDIANNIDRETQ